MSLLTLLLRTIIGPDRSQSLLIVYLIASNMVDKMTCDHSANKKLDHRLCTKNTETFL